MEKRIKNSKVIGANLRRLREDAGLSQDRLCAALQLRGCDIGRTTYAKYEAGETSIKAKVIAGLKKIYNCSDEVFFEGTEE